MTSNQNRQATVMYANSHRLIRTKKCAVAEIIKITKCFPTVMSFNATA